LCNFRRCSATGWLCYRTEVFRRNCFFVVLFCHVLNLVHEVSTYQNLHHSLECVRNPMTLKVDSSVVQMLREKFGPGWTIDDDRRFWTRMRGRPGLEKLRVDAKTLKQMSWQLSENKTDREFMKYRFQLITLCSLLHEIESFFRIIHPNLPHFFARFAAELFTEMLGRAELIAEEKAPQLLNRFGEIHVKASGTVTNSASARGATPGTA
jgi:hypothetical protein